MSRPLRVLMYHRILGPGSTMQVAPSLVSATAAGFQEQMQHLASHYQVLSADVVLSHLRERQPLPRRAVLITFDDGCRDFAEVAWPILRRLRLPATVFVPTAYPSCPDRGFWWDRLHAAIKSSRLGEVGTPCGRFDLRSAAARRGALKQLLRFVKSTPHARAMALVDELCASLGETERRPAEVLSWDEMRGLASEGVTIAAHTRTHPALTRMDPDEARQEIRRSADDVRREMGRLPAVFAYPFGDHDERIEALVRDEGFELALTCRDGHTRLPGPECLRVRRTSITPRTGPLLFRLRLTTAGSYVDRWRHRTKETGINPFPGPGAGAGAPDPPPKLAYIMSRFPKLTETFVLNEIVTIDNAGVPVEIYPLLRERQATTHPEAATWAARAHFHPFLSAPILRANAWFLRTAPRTYLKTWAEVLRGTWGSLNFFVGALGILPKSARFAYELQRNGVTHVHAHFATHPAVAALVIHRLTGIPFSFTAHGSDLHVDRRMLDVKLEAAAFAVTVSNFNREVIVRECGEHSRHKVRVIHCGVDVECFAPRGARAETPPLRIACVASLEEVKGHRFLIEAFRLLADRGIDFLCDLVGDGPLRRDIETRLAATRLETKVRLRGGQRREEVARLLAAAHVAVLTSHPTPRGKREGIPVALMEAMAAETAVVASDISGIPELITSEQNGILVPAGDPEALATALERLSRDPALRARLGRSGRERVLRDFELRTNALHLLQLMARRTSDPHSRSGEGQHWALEA